MVGTASIHSFRRNSSLCATTLCRKHNRQNLNVGWYWYSIVGLKASGVTCRMFHQDCAIPVAEIVNGCRASGERRVNSARKRSAAEEGATQRSQNEIEGSSSSPSWVR